MNRNQPIPRDINRDHLPRVPPAHYHQALMAFHEPDDELISGVGATFAEVTNVFGPDREHPAHQELFETCILAYHESQHAPAGRRILEQGHYCLYDGHEASIPVGMERQLYFRRMAEINNDVQVQARAFVSVQFEARHQQTMTMHVSVHLLMVVFLNLSFDQILGAIGMGLTAWPFQNYMLTHLSCLIPPRFFRRDNGESRDSTNRYSFRLPAAYFNVWQRLIKDSGLPIALRWWTYLLKSLFVQEWREQAIRVAEVDRVVYKVCVVQM
jgi:hypothetical protein